LFGDCFDGCQRHGSGEHAETSKQHPLRFGQGRVRPLERGVEAALALGRIARGGTKYRRGFLEALQELRRGQHTDSRCG